MRTDDLMDLYTNRHYDKVFKALEAVASGPLAGMFAKVSDPFPADYKKRHPSLSLGMIRRIKELREQGATIHTIAEMLGLPDETVRYHCPARQTGEEG